MASKSVSLSIPDDPPYDRQENWYESFVGRDLAPVIDSGRFRRYWFTRYGAIGQRKHILFRFDANDLEAAEESLSPLRAKFRLGPGGYTDYDIAGDIGRGEKSRFLGNNGRHQDAARRGDIAFDFLHASARLFIDCLTGPDDEGYWCLEPEKTSGFSVATSLEQFHHLFCNLSNVPTWIVICAHPGLPGHHVMSFEEFKVAANNDKSWNLIQLVRATF